VASNRVASSRVVTVVATKLLLLPQTVVDSKHRSFQNFVKIIFFARNDPELEDGMKIITSKKRCSRKKKSRFTVQFNVGEQKGIFSEIDLAGKK
jgi:hypothetical protein